jgi:hypothetical protein
LRASSDRGLRTFRADWRALMTQLCTHESFSQVSCVKKTAKAYPTPHERIAAAIRVPAIHTEGAARTRPYARMHLGTNSGGKVTTATRTFQ